MEYRYLGRSGMQVSRYCLGAMMFGGPAPEAESRDIIAAARVAGINFIDTADAYNGGESEVVVGRAIKADRDWWVLATKLANKLHSTDPNSGGYARRWIQLAVEGSLRRLDTDVIDILYLHKEDHAVSIDEAVMALGDMIRAGKIRAFGLSNHRGWRVAAFCEACDRLGVPRPVVSQPYYNIMNRMPETEHLPACAAYGLGVVPYSPLARGVLTGKYAPNVTPEEGSRAARKDKRMMETEWRHKSLEIVQTIKTHAEAKGVSPIDLAVGWVLNNRLITGCIAGPRTMEQWKSYERALAYDFTAEDEALIDSLVAPGHPSTPGYNDPQYPLEGRKPWVG
ncbi:MAG: aldo/keto reductase [Alphaproteobacteria bacterium]|nr:aldo/keto reductase [Alphaproteobacteria bacterium]